MGITFTGSKQIQTSANSVIWNNQTQASLSFFFRYELAGDSRNAACNGTIIAQRTNEVGFSVTLDGSRNVSDTIGLKFMFANGAGGSGRISKYLSTGTNYHIALTYDQGVQYAWINGIPTWVAGLSGPTPNLNFPFWIGGTPPGSPCIYSLGDMAAWNGYALTRADVTALRDGTLPVNVGGSASWRGRWTLAGTTGATPAIGNAGLVNDFGDSSYNLASITGAGSMVYCPPITAQPSAGITSAHIGTSGKTLAIFFRSLATLGETLPIDSVITPTIKINGGAPVALTNPWITGTHRCAMFTLPSGVVAVPSDTVTLTAPTGYINTVAGITQSVTNGAVANYTGKSAMGTGLLTKTLKMGLNFPHLGTSENCSYQVSRNMRWRLSTFVGVTVDSSGKPIAMGGTWATAILYVFNTDNNIDATQYPGVPGLYAVGWDDLNVASPTSFQLVAYGADPNTTITERVDLANPGVNGIGIVKVYDVQRTAGSPVVALAISLGMSNAAKTPQFDNLLIYGPGDFTYIASTPTVLDNADPFALCATWLDRMSPGLGSARWMDSTVDYAGTAPYADPECLREMTDFSWNGPWKKSWYFQYSQARAFVPASSFIYSSEMGSSFPATLASSIDANTTTLTISDAATAPVIFGLVLTVESEKMRVMGVSGTTVTVIRGALGTTKAPHTGPLTIAVNNRFPVSTLGQLGGSNGLVTEFVTVGPHGLKTGEVAYFKGSPWPDFTYTDGTLAKYGGLDRTAFVTGPNSFVIAMFSSNTGTSMTLGAPITLNPAVHQSWSSQPAVAGFPFEFVSKATARLPGCDIHINVPSCSSDSMVDEIARRVRDNFPTGRNVWLELSNEIWNPLYPYSYFGPMDRMLYPGNPQLPSSEFYLVRSGQVWQRFRDVFNAGGRNRGAEIKGVLNMHPKSPGDCQGYLALAQTHGIEVAGIAIGPYTDSDKSASSVTAYTAYDTAQCADLWIHDIYHNVTGDPSWPSLFAAYNGYIDAYNTATGFHCALYAYEGGIQYAMPQFDSLKLRDMIYDPVFYWIEQDFYALWQTNRFIRANIYAYSMTYVSNTAWGLYHWMQQPYGRGDGSDGKADNRLTLAQQGLPNSKLASVNHDQRNVSVRGAAIRAWNTSQGVSPVSWYNNAWRRRLPVTVDNTANSTSALSYHQVAISLTGTAYTAFVASAKADGSDIRVTDSDGTTLLQHAFEGIDVANSTVYLLVKVPAVAAGATRTIYVYYGNAAAASVSSYPTTVGPTITPSAPVDIYTQADTPGYNGFPLTVVLKNQTGGQISHNGEVLIFATAGSASNSGADGKFLQMRSTDNGSTWTKNVTNPVAGSSFVAATAGELLDGTILVCYSYDTNANTAAGKAKFYVAKSTDSGVTWTNLSTTPTNQVAVPWTSGTDVGVIYGNIHQQQAAGLILMAAYGAPAASPRYTAYLLSCPGTSDPTNGANWGTRGTIATSASLSFTEAFVVQTSSPNNYVAVMRLNTAPWDLYRAASTDGGITWSAPAAVGITLSATPGATDTPASPWLLNLASANYALFYSSRIGSTNWGSSCLVSTDGAATFIDRPPVQLMMHGNAIASYEYGYPSAGILANGKILWAAYRSTGTVNLVNLERCIVDEDYLANGMNAYDGCESIGPLWTAGANATVSPTHAHNGTNAFKIDNSAGANDYAGWLPWSANLAARGAKAAYSAWIYSTQIDALGVQSSLQDDQGNYSTNVGTIDRMDTYQDKTPFNIKYFNGVSFVDSGVVAPLNQFNKVTVLANCGAASSAIQVALNNAKLTTTLTNTQAGNAPYRINFQGVSRASTHLTTFWLDDVYTHQYTANIPAVTAGTEQVVVPTTATLSGPTSGPVSSPSTNFTITLDSPATASESFPITYAGGSISTSPVVIGIGSSIGTFTVTPSGAGANNVVLGAGLTGLAIVGSPVSYNAVAGSATKATLSGPSLGAISSVSAPFTITLDGPALGGGVSCPVTDSNGGDTVTASPVVIAVGQTTGTFTITASATPGTRNITLGATTPALTRAGSPIAYYASAGFTPPSGGSSVTEFGMEIY